MLNFIASLFTGPIINSILSSGKEWLQHRQELKLLEQKQALELKSAEHQAKIAKIEQDTKMYADADIESVKQWDKSFIDEIYKLAVLALFFAPFVPQFAPYAVNGANALAEYPLWVQLVILGTFISVLGLRFMIMAPFERLMGKRGNK